MDRLAVLLIILVGVVLLSIGTALHTDDVTAPATEIGTALTIERCAP